MSHSPLRQMCLRVRNVRGRRERHDTKSISFFPPLLIALQVGPGTTMGLFRWLLNSLYSWLGLAHKSGSVLLVGLDFAGKTTMLHLLKSGMFSCNAPTGIGTAEEVWIQ